MTICNSEQMSADLLRLEGLIASFPRDGDPAVLIEMQYLYVDLQTRLQNRVEQMSNDVKMFLGGATPSAYLEHLRKVTQSARADRS